MGIFDKFLGSKKTRQNTNVENKKTEKTDTNKLEKTIRSTIEDLKTLCSSIHKDLSLKNHDFNELIGQVKSINRTIFFLKDSAKGLVLNCGNPAYIRVFNSYFYQDLEKSKIYPIKFQPVSDEMKNELKLKVLSNNLLELESLCKNYIKEYQAYLRKRS